MQITLFNANKNVIIAMLIILLILIVFTQLSYGFTPDKFINGHFQPDKIEYYDYVCGSRNPFYSVCFIAGVHGNEPAGSETLKDLISSGYFEKFCKQYRVKIRVIPTANKWGLLHNTRYKPNLMYPDINRNFLGEGLEPTSQQIVNLVKDFDIVVDFHEGWGFHLINPSSVGSTVSPGDTETSMLISKKAVDRINSSIRNPDKKFVVLQKRSSEIPKTLSCFRENQQKHYLLVETSGQNNLQPMNVRKQQVFVVVDETLKYIGIDKRIN
jgi:hypothetical protein